MSKYLQVIGPLKGEDGKSAYQYAQDGGYTGTEAEFAEKLAAECDTYTLPVASSTVLGGVKPADKTDAMTQAVGVDANGALWTEPGSGGGSGGYEDTVLFEIATTEEVSLIESDTLSNLGVAEKLCNADFIYSDVSIVPPSNESYTANGKIISFSVFKVGVYPEWPFLGQTNGIVPKFGSNYNGEIKIVHLGQYLNYAGNPVRPMIGMFKTAQYIATKFTDFQKTAEKSVLENPGRYVFHIDTDTAFGAGTTIRIVARRYL